MLVKKIGIMQGRLTPTKGRGIQFFPFENWQNEFRQAPDAGIDEIEFIFDLDRYEENPLWTENGRQDIKSLISQTGVKVNHICADYFMRRPFFRVSEQIRKENVQILKKLIVAAKEIGAIGVEIPLVDNSSIKTEEEENLLIASLRECLPLAERQQITLGLEIDYPPKRFLTLLQKISHPWIRANYDSGNSSGLGFDPEEEINTYGQFVSNIHIKDRILGNGTVELGTGNADFDKLFRALKGVDYRGNFILQVARGVEGQEAETIKKQVAFLKGYINKYL